MIWQAHRPDSQLATLHGKLKNKLHMHNPWTRLSWHLGLDMAVL
jgi:hypothetical protein